MKLNRKARTALAKLYGNLGHQSYERLARTLVNDGASQDMIDGANGVRCMICERSQAPHSNPQASHKAPSDFNDQLFFHTFFGDAASKRFAVTHDRCGFSKFHVGRVHPNPSSKISAEVLSDAWSNTFGPLKAMQVDAGPEFRDHFARSATS